MFQTASKKILTYLGGNDPDDSLVSVSLDLPGIHRGSHVGVLAYFFVFVRWRISLYLLDGVFLRICYWRKACFKKSPPHSFSKQFVDPLPMSLCLGRDWKSQLPWNSKWFHIEAIILRDEQNGKYAPVHVQCNSQWEWIRSVERETIRGDRGKDRDRDTERQSPGAVNWNSLGLFWRRHSSL